MSHAGVDNPMLPARFRVRKIHRELHDTFTLDLAHADEQDDFVFTPGQFNMLYRFGIGEVPVSISGDPVNPATLVHTIRAVGAVTQSMARLKRGDMLGVRGPYGIGWPVQEAAGSDVVFVAGGLGLAPLRPAIYQVLAQRQQYGNVCVFYGARTATDILYRRELQSWRSRFDLTVDVIVDRAPVGWAGKVGVVTRLLGGGGFDPFHTVALVCGPEVMMRFSVQTLNEQGVEDRQIYVSMERNMKCAIGFCGHCQFGSDFICKDGPVIRYDRVRHRFGIREL